MARKSAHLRARGPQRKQQRERYSKRMPSVDVPGVLALASLLAFAPLMRVAAADLCSHDVFTIDGNSLVVELCVQPASKSGAKAAPVMLAESVTLRGQAPLRREFPLEVVGSAEASRTIDDVSLAKLGIAKTLHLTIAYKPGNVRLEHALLVPGAIALK